MDSDSLIHAMLRLLHALPFLFFYSFAGINIVIGEAAGPSKGEF